MTRPLEPAQVYELVIRDGEVVLGRLVPHELAEREGIPQACVYVAVVNPRGEVFVQHRAASKRLYPGRKTISVSGHVDPGETFEQAGVREVREELGIDVCALEAIGAFHGESHCGRVYEATLDQVPRPNADELDPAESRFMPGSELQRLLREPDLFTPSGRKALELWLEHRGLKVDGH